MCLFRISTRLSEKACCFKMEISAAVDDMIRIPFSNTNHFSQVTAREIVQRTYKKDEKPDDEILSPGSQFTFISQG